MGDGQTEPDYSGVRFDLLATDALGSPFRWRLLAEHNEIANPLQVPPGAVLSVPPLDGAAVTGAALATPTAVVSSTGGPAPATACSRCGWPAGWPARRSAR